MDVGYNKKVFERLLKLKKIQKSDRILVIGGLEAERDFFVSLNFKNVTISNISEIKRNLIAPFKFTRQNINHLTFRDNSFDFVFVSASLHHSSSPASSLLEMYRVAKKGIIVTEVRDSAMARLGQKIGMIPEYEIAAVVGNRFSRGGVDNTEIPNYVYRWTERELKKIVSSFNPTGKHEFIFFYKFSPSFSHDKLMGKKLKYYLLKFMAIIAIPFVFLIKNQGNIFSAVVLKPHIPKDLFPWLKIKKNKITFNPKFKG